jgi:hypothetical protein
LGLDDGVEGQGFESRLVASLDIEGGRENLESLPVSKRQKWDESGSGCFEFEALIARIPDRTASKDSPLPLAHSRPTHSGHLGQPADET